MPRFEPSFPLVEAKLQPPTRRRGMISRGSLVERLRAEPRTPVVSVIAPPGYGKTVLLTEWAATEARPVAWLTLDDFDNVPSVFLSYLAVAVDRIHPVEPSLQAEIVAPGIRILAAAVPRLATELHRMARPAAIVLDDAHRLVDRTCLDALAALIDHLPPDLQLVIAGRNDPGLPLARLRARRELLEIGADDLALTAAETQALSSEAGRDLTADEAVTVHRHTEGWAAATYLAALAGRDHPLSPRPYDGVSGRDAHIAAYLRSELTDHLDAPDLALLPRTSVLDVVEPPVAEALAEQPGAAGRLRELAGRNRLIVEIGEPGSAYRYHNLLRDFLRAELERLEPGTDAALHRRAATWYAASGRTELAIEHALLGDVEAAARLVTATTLRSLFGGNADKLDRWITAFDDTAFSAYPPLAVMGAWVHLLNGRPREAAHLAAIAEGASFTGDPGDGASSFEVSRAMLRCVMGRGEPDALLACATAAVEAEPPPSPWRTNALLMLGAEQLRAGDVAAADSTFARAVDAGAVAGATVAWAMRAILAIDRGDWSAAEGHVRESHALVVRGHLDHLLPSLVAFATAARVAVHRGNLAAARAELVRAQLVRPLASEAAPWYCVSALLELARAYMALSDLEGARSAVAEAEAIARRSHPLGTLGAQLSEIRERLRLASSHLAGASALTSAELRVLPVLATPLTFKEVGQRLFLSHHTVKTHAISIYGKLQAGSRSEAIERAIEIGLLEPYPTLEPRRRPDVP